MEKIFTTTNQMIEFDCWVYFAAVYRKFYITMQGLDVLVPNMTTLPILGLEFAFEIISFMLIHTNFEQVAVSKKTTMIYLAKLSDLYLGQIFHFGEVFYHFT